MALNLLETVQEDNSITSQQLFPFNPINGTQYNNAGIVQIDIENQLTNPELEIELARVALLLKKYSKVRILTIFIIY